MAILKLSNQDVSKLDRMIFCEQTIFSSNMLLCENCDDIIKDLIDKISLWLRTVEKITSDVLRGFKKIKI